MASGCSSVATCTRRIRTSASVGPGDDSSAVGDGVLADGLVVSDRPGCALARGGHDGGRRERDCTSPDPAPIDHLTMVRNLLVSRDALKASASRQREVRWFGLPVVRTTYYVGSTARSARLPAERRRPETSDHGRCRCHRCGSVEGNSPPVKNSPSAFGVTLGASVWSTPSLAWVCSGEIHGSSRPSSGDAAVAWTGTESTFFTAGSSISIPICGGILTGCP